MKESFNTLTNLVNLLSTELIVDEKIKAKQLTDLQLFSHIKKIYISLFRLQLTVTYYLIINVFACFTLRQLVL